MIRFSGPSDDTVGRVVLHLAATLMRRDEDVALVDSTQAGWLGRAARQMPDLGLELLDPAAVDHEGVRVLEVLDAPHPGDDGRSVLVFEDSVEDRAWLRENAIRADETWRYIHVKGSPEDSSAALFRSLAGRILDPGIGSEADPLCLATIPSHAVLDAAAGSDGLVLDLPLGDLGRAGSALARAVSDAYLRCADAVLGWLGEPAEPVLRPRSGDWDLEPRFVDPERPYRGFLDEGLEGEFQRPAHLARRPLVVVLGEQGSGKSAAFERLADDAWQLIDLGAVTPSDLDERLEAIQRTAWLDALDQWPHGARLLAAKLGAWVRGRAVPVRVRVACRTHAWGTQLGNAISAELGRATVVALAPLTRAEVLAAATDDEDPGRGAAFLQEVERANLESFAARPQTLRWLLSEFTPDRPLKGDRRGLGERAIRRLLDDDPKAPSPSTTLDHRVRIAAALAWGTLLAGRIGIALREDVDGSVTPSEAVEISYAGRADVEEVLERPLFSGLGIRRFAHASYAEELAAEHATRLPVRDVERLVFEVVGPHRYLPEHLRGFAHGLAARSPPFLMRLARAEPESVLRAGVDLDDRARAALLDALVERRRAGRTWLAFLPDELLARLRHAGLSAQIAPWLTDADWRIRKLAARLAMHAEAAELVPTLTEIALGVGEPALRVACVQAVAALGAPAALRPLVEPSTEDPEDEVRGAALRVLWPEHVSAAELFGALQRPCRENFFGQYELFLRTAHIAAYLDRDEVVLGLRWAIGFPTAGWSPALESLAAVVSEVIGAGWALCQPKPDDPVTAALADVVVAWAEAAARAGLPSWDDAPRRRALLVAVIRNMEPARLDALKFTMAEVGLFAPEDAEWALARYEAGGEERWAVALQFMLRRSLHEGLRPRLEAIAELKSRVEWFFAPSSPQRPPPAAPEAPPTSRPARFDDVERWLRDFRDHPNLWPTVARRLCSGHAWASSPGTTPGWHALPGDAKDAVLDAATRFLEAGPVTEDLAGVRAWRLVSELHVQQEPKVWARWASVFANPHLPETEHLIVEAHRIVPRDIERAGVAVLAAGDGIAARLLGRALMALENPSIEARLTEVARDLETAPAVRSELLTLLLPARPDLQAWASERLDLDGVVSAVVTACPDACWPAIKRWLGGADGRDRLLSVWPSLPYSERGPLFSALGSEQKAELYTALEAHFPRQTDVRHVGTYSPTAEDDLRKVRDRMLSDLVDAGEHELVERLPEVSSVVIERARERGVSVRRRPPSIAELIALDRPIQTVAQLLAVVLDELDDIQDVELDGESGAVVDLVDGKPGCWRLKDEDPISWWLGRQLHARLGGRGVTVIMDAPEGARRKRPDLRITKGELVVKIEAKGAWNTQVLTAQSSQLVRYLQRHPRSAGVYLVYWPAGDTRWDANDPKRTRPAGITDPADLQDRLALQSAGLTEETRLDLTSRVLTIRY